MDLRTVPALRNDDEYPSASFARNSGGNAGKAIRLIEEGKQQIEKFYRSVNQPEWIESSSELAFLNEWLHEVAGEYPFIAGRTDGAGS